MNFKLNWTTAIYETGLNQSCFFADFETEKEKKDFGTDDIFCQHTVLLSHCDTFKTSKSVLETFLI